MAEAFLEKKKILILLWHPETKALSSGGFVRIKEFLKWAPEDFTVDILDSYPTIFKKEEVSGEIFQYKIPAFLRHIENKFLLFARMIEGIFSFLAFVKKGFSLNKARRYDAIYIPTGETFTVFAAIVLRRLSKVRIVLDSLNVEMPGGSWGKYYKQLRNCGYSVARSFLLPSYIYVVFPILVKCFNRADHIVTVSPYLIRKLQKLGVKKPIDFTASGINFNYFANFPSQKKIYDGIFIGRHEIAKGIFDLINAWRAVVKSCPSAKLAMIGYCDASTKFMLMQKMKENNLSDNILLAGELSEENKVKYLQQSKVYIHLSPMEPLFPVISILEGFACGLPLVSYDCPAYQEIEEIYRHSAISLVSLGDYEKAASEILRFLQLNEKETAGVGQLAQEYARTFDWKEIAHKQFNIIRKVASAVNNQER